MTTTAEHCWFNDVFVPIPVELLKEKEKKKKEERVIHISKCSSQSATQYKGIVCLSCPSQANFWKTSWIKNDKKKKNECVCTVVSICTVQIRNNPNQMETTRCLNLVILVSVLNSRLWWTSQLKQRDKTARNEKKKSEIKKQTFCVSAAVKPPFCSPAWEGRTSHSLITNKPSTKGTDFIIRMNWPFKLS